MRKRVREEGKGDLSRCTRIQFNAQGTQCAEWIIPPQSQISLYRPNSAAATTTNAAANLANESFIPGAFISPGARLHLYRMLRARACTCTYTLRDPYHERTD